MIANASGKMPPPAPCTTRPAIITLIDEASAETSVPRARMTRMISRTRSLPYMSPRRPMIGVATDALRRYAVSIQLTAVSDVCSDRRMSGSAGSTSDCIKAYDIPAATSTANVTW